MVKGLERPPNAKWAEEHEGQQLQLEYEDATYVVEVREVSEDDD